VAAIFTWCEDNGPAIGNPAHGFSRSRIPNPPINISWKSVDDAKTDIGGTSYSSAPIQAGTNSFSKYHYGQFGGTYNRILNCVWSAHVEPESALPPGLILKGVVTSQYQQPTQNHDNRLIEDFTDVLPIDAGLPVGLSPIGPESPNHSPILDSGGGFTQYLVTQLQTLPNVRGGDTDEVTMMIQFDEN